MRKKYQECCIGRIPMESEFADPGVMPKLGDAATHLCM